MDEEKKRQLLINKLAEVLMSLTDAEYAYSVGDIQDKYLWDLEIQIALGVVVRTQLLMLL